MVSLAFYFEPAVSARQDDTGLTRPQSIATAREMDLGRDLIDRVAAIEDIDDKLDANRELKLKMFSKCVALLSTLRYDMDAYKTFAMAD